MFIGHRSIDDPRTFFLYEQYDDEPAFRAHTETEHFKQLVLGDAVPRLEIARARLLHDPGLRPMVVAATTDQKASVVPVRPTDKPA